MPVRDLSAAEMRVILEQQRILRIAFVDESGPYLVPLGYVWHEGRICCITSEGRKTQLVRKDGRVSFQVDTSAETGPYAWRSITGQGIAEIADDPAVCASLFPLLLARFSEMPEWARDEITSRQGERKYVVLRISAVKMTGRSCAEFP